ncbi:hypothetical protein [Natrarchaeobaculum sulfurireducens]|uniref:Uncharacterized protein n=1 Tax=Natrarchaeobaculum sulfurireducens TaxID=2044521 RepID=A0A346PBI5_9EURY|nr:hypothetical protein [Natrarchaeobaculum sulfurireducens]AXR76880.1 hypothetical protein AArc1_0536 [Natrarchaeobaculum sulfurireducens]
MPVRRLRSLAELFRVAPAKSFLLAVGPPALAAGQLLNSYVNGLSPAVATGFAVAMVAFAIVATSHHAAEVRLQQLEGDPESQAGVPADGSD